MEKFLVISVPFHGHLNILVQQFRHLHDQCIFFITSWKNNQLSKIQHDELNKYKISYVEIISSNSIDTCNPKSWCKTHLRSAYGLCDKYLQQFIKHHHITTIIYDIFAWSGYFLAKKYKLRYLCSIPAFLGSYKPSRQIIQWKKNVALLHAISDGYFIPGEYNLVWSTKNVTNQLQLSNKLKFFTYDGMLNPLKINIKPKPCIIISFGTVVPGYLWEKNATVRTFVTAFLQDLIKNLEKYKHIYDIYLSTGACHSLTSLFSSPLPEWIKIEPYLDQPTLLQSCHLFVTHGGNNSFHEALYCGVPMLVVPFFGDQHAVGAFVKNQQLGDVIPLDAHNARSTAGKKDRSWNLDIIDNILETREQIQQRCCQLRFSSMDFPHLSTFVLNKMDFKNGDLLFGTNLCRTTYVQEKKLNFHMNEYKPWSVLEPDENCLPPIIDNYHDSILNVNNYIVDMKSHHTEYKKRLQHYKSYVCFLDNLDFSTVTEKNRSFGNLCCRGMDFFLRFYPNTTIHFLMTRFYDPTINLVTYMEIEHVLKHHRDLVGSRILFYNFISHQIKMLTVSEILYIQHKSRQFIL